MEQAYHAQMINSNFECADLSVGGSKSNFIVVQDGAMSSTTKAKVIRTPQKSAIDHRHFLMKIKQGKHQQRMLAESGETAQRPHALKVGFQSSMSEEHPTNQTKFMDAGSSSLNEDGISSLDKSKIITYRPLKSVCDSENSPGIEGEKANLASDSDSGHQGDSKSSLR